MQGVLLRRMLILVAALLLLAAVASAIAPRDEERAVKPPPGSVPARPAADVVEATLPADRTVRARVGDVVQLEVVVESGGADIAQIAAYGVEEPVEPGLPGLLFFDADRAGRFAVTLREARRRVGSVVVRAAEDEAAPATTSNGR